MAVKVLAKRGTAAQIEGAASSIQSSGEIAFATDTKDFYVSDGTQFNKITDIESDGNFYVSGNVGIGTTSLGTAKVVIDHTNTKMLELKRNGATKARFIADSNNGQLDLYDSSTVNSVRLLSSGNSYFNGGNVGIGTTSPTSPLHVVGNLFVDGSSLKVVNNSVTNYYDSDRMNSYGTYYDWRFAGNTKMRITSAGNVGIGTTSPTALLHLESAEDSVLRLKSTDNKAFITLQDDDTNTYISAENSKLSLGGNPGVNANNLNFDISNNFVGIGTSSPAHKLDVSGDVHLNNLQLSDFTGDIYFGVNSANNKFSYNQWLASASGGMVIKNTANASTGHIAFETSTGEALRIIRGGQLLLNGTTTSFSDKLYINGDAYVNGAWRVGTSGTYVGKLYNTSGILTLESDSTRDIQFGSVTNGTAMFIEGTNGNIGIGTTSPNAVLDVQGSKIHLGTGGSNTNRAFFIADTTNDTFEFNNSVGDRGIRIKSNNGSVGGSAASRLYGAAGGVLLEGANGQENIALTTDGKVGIGTTTPAVKLDVAYSEPIIRLTDTRNLNVGDWDDVSLGRIQFYTSDTTSPGARTLAEIQAYSGTSAASAPEAQLIFKTSTRTDSAPVQRMVIDSEGRLGLGTTNPHQILTVAGNITQTDNSYLISTRKITARDSAGLSLYNDGGQGIDIKDNNNVIVTSGNVGIGNTSPSYKLDLNGGTENTLASFSSTDQTAQLRIVDSSNVPFYFGVIGTGAYITPTGATPADGISIRNTGNVGIGVAVPTHKLDVKGDISADEFLQAPSGIPRANLGDPTVTEMALFESQMSCKTDLSDDYTDLTKVTFWQQPNEGDAWSQVTVSDDNKKKFLRTNNSSIVIPNGTYRYRVEFEPKSYRSAQAFYCYHSYRGNAFAVHVWKRRCSDNQWFQHTDSDVEVGKWPGHLYLPMDAIFWHPTDTTSTYRYNLIRIEFIPNWSASNTYNIDLYGGQLWGGYPAGRRTPHTYDHEGQLTLPANLIVPDDLIVSSGNVGIGTTSPQVKLDVEGVIYSRDKFILIGSSGSSTRYAVIEQNGTEGVFRLYNGNNWGLIARGVGNGPYIGAYREGKLRIRGFGQSDGSDDATDKDLAIFDFATERVGIGTTSPSAKLDVVGNIKIGADQNIFSDGSITIGIDYNNNQTDRVFNIVANNSTEVFRVQEDGKVGIGTTSLSYAFNVNSGGAETVGFFKSTDSRARILVSDDDTNTYVGSENGYGFFGGQASLHTGNLVINSTNGNVGIGTINPPYKLTVQGSAYVYGGNLNIPNGTYGIVNAGNTSQKLYFPSLGNFALENVKVGIGTTSPTTPLDVSGAITIRNSASLLRKYESTWANADTHDILYQGWTSTMGDYVYLKAQGNSTGDHGMLIVGDNVAYIGRSNVETGAVTGLDQTWATFKNDGVGIGTTSPTEKLHVVGNIKIEDLNPTIKLLDTNGADWDIELEDNHLRFKVGSTEYVRFQNGGNVGIGTTSSAAKLQVVHTDASVDTLRLGRSDNSSYWRINHAGNDFRLFNEAASGADILLGVDSGGNAENNKVGIGTATPSEKLEVSGNIKASGTIKGKMEQMFACSFSDDLGTTKHYLSFTSNAEQTNVHADQAAMVMPYNGRVKAIQMRLSNIDADTIRTFGIETIAPGINMYASSNNWTIEETESYELAATDDFYLVNYVFSNTNHFESGDLLAISIQDAEDAYTASRQTYVNVIIEYDLNNGMGNDTATTKYTS